jgi:hypothetical protein
MFPIWSWDLLAKVQFPWRAISIAEFAAITALARQPRSAPAWMTAVPFVMVALAAPRVLDRTPLPLDRFVVQRMDVPENFPKGGPEGVFPQASIAALELARVNPGKKFWFPSLGKERDGPLLVGSPRLETLPEERFGAFLSILGLAVYLAQLLVLTRKQPPPIPCRRNH